MFIYTIPEKLLVTSLSRPTSGLTTSGLTTSGLATSGPTTYGLMISGRTTSGQTTIRLTISWLKSSGLTASRLATFDIITTMTARNRSGTDLGMRNGIGSRWWTWKTRMACTALASCFHPSCLIRLRYRNSVLHVPIWMQFTADTMVNLSEPFRSQRGRICRQTCIQFIFFRIFRTLNIIFFANQEELRRKVPGFLKFFQIN